MDKRDLLQESNVRQIEKLYSIREVAYIREALRSSAYSCVSRILHVYSGYFVTPWSLIIPMSSRHFCSIREIQGVRLFED